ncbi:MAG TPA: hypothetical protein VHM01_20005 [Alphaproteobacteria bacterium]|nr:hypothetical protein [Alphaproteobacteria bacterium]
MPSNDAASSTIIPLSAVSGGRSAIPGGKSSAAPNPPPRRRGSRGSDLIFGGTLAFILLIACLTWEMLSQGTEVPHTAVESGHQRAFIPAVH